jgi:hypothetical protein
VKAQISRLSGYCYSEWDNLKAAVSAEGLNVVAGGDTYFTRWYIATGKLYGGPPAKEFNSYRARYLTQTNAYFTYGYLNGRQRRLCRSVRPHIRFVNCFNLNTDPKLLAGVYG